jgi:hypothetical protein
VNDLRKLILLTLCLAPINFVLAQSATSDGSVQESTGEPVPPTTRPQFESASVAVPAGNSCIVHPAGDTDPRQSIRLNSDADGIARFQAVRAAAAGSVEQLALDCIDSTGTAETYAVDLRSEETFAPRPFNPVQAGLKLRPALSGDPLSYTQQQLLEAGYGLRPDPTANREGYERWLAAVSVPAYQLRSSGASAATQPRASQPAAPSTRRAQDKEVVTTTVFPQLGWTGAELKGSHQLNGV